MDKKKKILTLDDLCAFYMNQNKSCTFSSKETGYELSVHVPAQFEVNKEVGDDNLLFCKVKLMHSGENRNHSSVTDDALKKASKALAYKPILANFMEYTDAETGETLRDFTSHDMVINGDDIDYIEGQIGCFTADKPYFEVEEDTGHNFLYGYCAIPRIYTEAASIIERKGGTKVSVELNVKEMQYSAKKKLLELTDIDITGATCLGKNPDTLKDVEEGMKNARIDIADFSVENNSVRFDKDSKIIELLEKLNFTLSNFNNNISTEEGGNKPEMNLFETLLSKYGKTADDVTFEYEGLSDEELTAKFEEEFGEGEEDPKEEPTDKPDDDDNGDAADNEGTPESDAEPVENAGEAEADTTIEYSFNVNGVVKQFKVSLQDKIYAIQDLVNATYSEQDNTYYGVTVYDEYVIMNDWCSGRYFRQSYTADKQDNYSLTGDRVEVFVEFITEDEQKELDSMRANYSALVQFKADVENKELHALRENVLADEKYSVIAEKNESGEYVNASYAELYSNMDKYSVEELEKEAKVILADYAINGGKFAAVEPEEKKPAVNSVKVFANPNNTKKVSKYGNLKFH